MIINPILLFVMLVAGIWTVMARSVIKAAIGLAVTSAIVAITIFRLNSPIAAVFELSVCAGLITVIFVSTISLTRPLTHKEVVEISKRRYKRYIYLPLIISAIAWAMISLKIPNEILVKPDPLVSALDMRNVLWGSRTMDLFAQALIIMIGAIGVVTLFIERGKNGRG
jgi:NADH-quinone oxidoreductase subunit J